MQQLGTSSQTHTSHAQPSQPGPSLREHPPSHSPQSEGQEPQSSTSSLHTPSPQNWLQVPSQEVAHKVTHSAVHAMSQQVGSRAHTHSSQSQPQHSATGAAPQPSSELPHCSVHRNPHSASHSSSQQEGFFSQTQASHPHPSHPANSLALHPLEHGPQSTGQLEQVSPLPV